MYLHLGQETVVRSSEIIGMFDLDKTSVSKITRDFLSASEKKKTIINVNNELPKSFIVTASQHQQVYISQISTATLKKRSEYGQLSPKKQTAKRKNKIGK